MKRLAVAAALAIFYALVLYTTNGCGGVWSGAAMRTPQPQPDLEIEGTVRDAVTNAPIAGAQIVVAQGHGTFRHAASSSGTYAVAGLVEGVVHLTVSAPGYRNATETFPVVKGRNRFDVALTPEP